MSFSLNEIEALAKRAARGAGLPWGLAEEAAFGVRWLASYGLSGPEMLVDLLAGYGGDAYADVAPRSFEGDWKGPCGRLDPLICGTLLSDNAARLPGRSGIVIENVTHPLLLLPFAAGAVAQMHRTISLEWQGAKVSVDKNGPGIEATDQALNTRHAVRVTCAVANPGLVAANLVTRRHISDNCRDRLGQFGEQSLAPATDESRARGAGDGAGAGAGAGTGTD